MSMTSLYYGMIKEERLETWKENSNPYDILDNPREIAPKIGFSPYDATKICSDEVQVDWGSFAYKCTKQQLRDLEKKCRMEIKGIEELDDETVYGLVWIEEY